MKYKLADDAKPQVKLLLIATVITIGLWFIPYAEYLVYPVRLFVTFIHESSHALIALITGGAVQSLTIAADGSGVVYSASRSVLGAVFTSSAGYLGTTAFGVLMLFLIRKNVAASKVLFALGAFVGVMTLIFGVVLPIFNIFTLQVTFGNQVFTVVAGLLIAAGLIATAMYTTQRVANFIVAFLAVQCLLNAISDLKTILFINAPLIGSDISNDAGNMAAATGLPAFLWVLVWIVVSAGFLLLGVRMYSAVKGAKPSDTLFVDSK